jgi:catechol 2,3-dioxygenase-like lactoylglutathione lyase family enzyme
MIDHITIAVSDLQRSKHFYERAFAPLGYSISFGKEGIFWTFDVGDGLFEISAAMSERPPSRACMWLFGQGVKKRSLTSIELHLTQVRRTMIHPVLALHIARVTTRASS